MAAAEWRQNTPCKYLVIGVCFTYFFCFTGEVLQDCAGLPDCHGVSYDPLNNVYFQHTAEVPDDSKQYYKKQLIHSDDSTINAVIYQKN